jgi:hypothetical protein
MPSTTETQYLHRIDALVERGKDIQRSSIISHNSGVAWVTQQAYHHENKEYDDHESKVWRTNFTTLAEAILSQDSEHWKLAQTIIKCDDVDCIDRGIPFLCGIREDIHLGLLRRAEQRIEAEVAVDYIEMAERLFTEAGPDTHRHLAATVIAGAVFEHGLRALAQRHNLKVTTDDGKPLMINGLIDVVKKAEVVTELDAKSMRAWAGIRNAAAHGQFAEVTEAKAKVLISGVTAFLTEHQ